MLPFLMSQPAYVGTATGKSLRLVVDKLKIEGILWNPIINLIQFFCNCKIVSQSHQQNQPVPPPLLNGHKVFLQNLTYAQLSQEALQLAINNPDLLAKTANEIDAMGGNVTLASFVLEPIIEEISGTIKFSAAELEGDFSDTDSAALTRDTDSAALTHAITIDLSKMPEGFNLQFDDIGLIS